MGWLGFITSIVAALVALWIALADQKASRRIKALATVAAVASAIALFDGFRNAKEDERFQREMRVRTEETLHQLTGGDGFTEVSLMDLAPNNRRPWLIINNPHGHPLYDISLTIVDLEKQAVLERRGSSNSFFESITTIGPLNLGPKQVHAIKSWTVGEGDQISYGINVVARNGHWFQALRYRLINGKWVRASQVTKNDKVASEHVDDTYPRDGSGKVSW